jgi:MoaA/NifB/PqqE/SkfB family radical SAM enzyme
MKRMVTITRLGKNLVHYIKRTPAMFLTNILLTYKCTQSCLQCSIPSNKAEKPYMALEDFKVIIDRLATYGTQIVNISGGEPLLHPDLPEVLNITRNRGFSKIQLLSTFYASEKIIDRIIPLLLRNKVSLSCSFDGFGEIADKLRGARNVSKTVMRGMEKLDVQNKRLGKPIDTAVNVVINQQNLDQVPEIIDYITDLGWKTYIDIYRWSSNNHNEVEFLKIKDFDKLRSVLDQVKKSPVVFTPEWLINGFENFLKNDFDKKCPYLDSVTFGSKFFIHPNGDIKVCIGEAIGNIIRQTPSKIFSSKEWEKAIINFKKCNGCWNACYTPLSSLLNFLRINEIKSYYKIIVDN